MYTKRAHKILMVAYLFPPLGGSGALRPLKLAKYLPSVGWEPIIVTVKNPDWYYATDPKLLLELSSKTVIRRSFMFRATWFYRILNPLRIARIDNIINRYLFHPDEQVGWLPFGYLAAKRLLRKHNVEAIYSTSGPLTCHLIATLLKKKTGLPWIAEFRDEWIEAPNLNLPTPWYERFHYRLEGAIVRGADKVIVMAPAFSKFLSKHCTNPHKFVTITGGFDPDDFIPFNRKAEKSKEGSQFSLLFAGLFYPTFRPKPLLKAISDLIEEGKLPAEDIKIQFVGGNRQDDLDFFDKHGVCDFVGFVSRKEALGYLFSADALLLLLSRERGAYIIPTKVFEYMASGKPILALVPAESSVARIIRETNTGLVVDFEDVDGIKLAYLRLYKGWKENRDVLGVRDWEKIGKYEQKAITKRLAEELYQLIAMR